jgi:hypothetical protein
LSKLPELLLVGHLPNESPETPLVLAAVAAFNGLQCDGTPMHKAKPRAPSMRDVAELLGVGVDAVRRGKLELVAAGALREDRGMHANPAALRARWFDDRVFALRGAEHREPAYRYRLKLTKAMLARGVDRCEPLLVAALVAGQIDERAGRLCLGVPFIGERTGLAGRTVDRALQTLRRLQVVRTWKQPIRGGGFRSQLFLALVAAGVEERRPGPRAPSPMPRGGEAAGPLSRGGRERRVEAAGPLSRGGRVPDGPPDSSGLALRTRAAGPGQTGTAEQPAEASHNDATLAVAEAILRTPYRSHLDADARRCAAFRCAVLLRPTRITADQVGELWQRCQTTPGIDDPPAHFAALMDRCVWREFLERRAALDRHVANRRRGDPTRNRERVDGPYGGTEPKPAASYLPELLRHTANGA